MRRYRPSSTVRPASCSGPISLSVARKQYPGLTECIKVISENLAESYLRALKIAGQDIEFLTKEAPEHFRNLRDARNKVEHEPGSSVTPSDVRNLYRMSLGIGCRGMLPEMVRLLSNLHTSPHASRDDTVRVHPMSR